MNSETAFAQIKHVGLLAGMRGDFRPEIALRVAESLLAEGINIFEFTMNSVEPLAAMQAVKAEFGEDVCAGMGTVLDAETAARVLDAEPDFIVSPSFSPAVVEKALMADVLIAPGVITPTECVDAWAMGVKILKIFPIGPLGLDYFKAVRGPLDHMSFMANGGIDPDTVRAFIGAGATACGAAGWLTGDGTWPVERIRERARLLVQAVAEGRGEPRHVTI